MWRSRVDGRPISLIGPSAALPDPDSWVRRWGTICGGALVLGSLWPLHRGSLSRSMVNGPGDLAWPWQGGPDVGYMFWLLPFAFGIAAIVSAHRLDRGPRAVTLFFLGALGPISAAVFSVGRALDGRRGEAQPAIVLLMIFSMLSIAVGNHVRKRFPASPAARLLAGLGGVVLLLSFAVPVFQGHPAVAIVADAEAWRHGWTLEIEILLILLYGILALGAFARASSAGGGSSALSALARAVTVGFPLGLFAFVLIDAPPRSVDFLVMMLLKMHLLLLGVFFLAAVGLAAWMEASLTSRTRQPLRPSELERVFE